MRNLGDEICDNCGKILFDPNVTPNDCPGFKPTGRYKNMSDYQIKDSGKREEFSGGMVRDTNENKIDYTNVLHGPMFKRWAQHLTKAKAKYPDQAPGVPNWTLAKGEAEYHRFRESALRHFIQWWEGNVDEDHAAAVFFNINGAEFVRENLKSQTASSEASVDLRGTWVPGTLIRIGDKDKN